MAWFAFSQNNSGGYFAAPAIKVVVESCDKEEAARIAEVLGVDESAPFCACCGERWYLSFPKSYGSKPSLQELFGGHGDPDLYKRSGVPRVIYVATNGSREVVE